MSSKSAREGVRADEEVDEFIMVDSEKLRPISELQAWLEPTDYLSPGNEYMKHLHSHVPGTGEALRTSEVFRDWKSQMPQDANPRNNCLWIKGVPGSGKSVFSASTTKQLHDEGNPVLFFFFRQIVATNHDPKYLVRDWLAQFLPHAPWLHRRLHELSKSNNGAYQDMTTLWDILVQSLYRMDKPVYCIADGLDEMDDTHADFIETLKTLGTGSAGSHVKVLLTSRPIPRIEQKLRDCTVTAMKLDPTMLYPDIAHYVEVRLNTLDPKLSTAKYQEVKEAICERAKGLFLHARLMTDNLTTGLREGRIVEETLPTSLERLPRNLQELYTEMLNEHSSRSGITQEQQFMILQCVVHSSRPLRLIELGSLVMMLRSETGMDLKEGKSLVRQSCGRLLEILEDESVSVIHHSFTEFLRDTERDEKEGSFPILDKEKAHAMLVIISLKYLNRCEVTADALWEEWKDPDEEEGSVDEEYAVNDDSWDRVDDLDTRDGREAEDKRKTAIVQTLRLKYPLLDYVIGNLSHHLNKADAKDTDMYSALDDWFQPDRPAFTIWLLMEWQSYRPENITALHVASFKNWHYYAQRLISNGIPVDQKDAEERTALSYAAEEGHVKAASLLLQHGAEPDADDRYGLKPLHYAAQEGKVEVVKQLLAKGVSPVTLKTRTTPEWIAEQFGSDKGETPIEYACQRGHMEIFREFLPLVDQEWRQKAFGWVKDVENMRAILQAGDISIDQCDGQRTKLYWAVSNYHTDVVKVLLQQGANPNVRSAVKRDNTGSSYGCWPSPDGITYPDGPTPMHGWANYDYWNSSYDRHKEASECFQLLMDAGSDIHVTDKDGWTPLHCACLVQGSPILGSSFDDGKDHLVKTLLEAGANPNARTSYGETPLHLTHRPEVIDMLVKHGADASITNGRGETPLMAYLAPAYGDKKSATFKKLLQISTQPNQRQKGGNTAMHGLMRCLPKFSDPVLFQILIDSGIDVNTRDTQGRSPLLVVGQNGSGNDWRDDEKSRRTYGTIFKTLKNAGMDMNVKDSMGRTILHVLIGTHSRSISTLEYFIELGCDPHARDSEGATMLHHVLRTNDSTTLGMFNLFIGHGVDPLAVDCEGNTLMHEAVRSATAHFPAFLGKLQKLRDLGLPTDTPNRAGRTPFHLICAEWRQPARDREFIEVFLQGETIPRSNINAVDNDGATPFHYAVIACEANVKQLLNAGADPEVLTHEGLSLLHLAARARQPNIVGILLEEYRKRGVLEHYVQLKHIAWPKWTALHYACSSGRPESVHYLLEAGADPNIRDIRGITPAHAVAQFIKREEPGPGRIQRASESLADKGVVGARLKDHPGHGYVGLFRHFDFSTERVFDIIEMLARAGARLDYERQTDYRLGEGGKMTPMDLAIEFGCAEMVIDLRKRGFSARDTFGEQIIGRCRDSQEAEVILQIPLTNEAEVLRARGEDTLPSFSMSAKEKIERVLKLADYDLLRELGRRSEDLRLEALYALTSWGHAFLLEEFLEGVEDVDQKTARREGRYTKTLLGTACSVEMPNLPIIKVLLEKAKVDVNARFVHDRFGKQRELSAVHVLAEGRYFWQIEALDYVLSQGAEVDSLDHNASTPLLIAVASEFGIWRHKIVETLLKHGADPNILSSEGKSTLHFAETADHVRVLIEHGANAKLGISSPLLSAIQQRRIDVARALLEAGADPNALFRVSSDKDATINHLHTAAERLDPNSHWSDEVLDARRAEKEQLVLLLLEHRADPMVIYEDGATVLQRVIEDHGLAATIVTSSSTVDLEKKGKGGRTPVISSCYPKEAPHRLSYQKQDELPYSVLPDVAKLLIKRDVNVLAVDDSGRTALHWLCSLPLEFSSACREVFTLLTSKAPSLATLPDLNGWTPFHLAAAANQTWATDTLITLGIDPTSADPDGNIALHILAPLMFGKNADAEKASLRFKHFLSLGLDINARNNTGSTPLSLFIAQSYVPETTSHRRQRGQEYSPTTHSTHAHYLSIFLDAGADLFTVNNKGEGLLHLTAGRADDSRYNSDHKTEITGTFEELLGKGLDPRLEDGECRTAIDIAVAKGYTEIVALFRED